MQTIHLRRCAAKALVLAATGLAAAGCNPRPSAPAMPSTSAPASTSPILPSTRAGSVPDNSVWAARR